MAKGFSHQVWTPEMDQFLSQNYRTMSHSSLALALGIPLGVGGQNTGRITTRLKTLGLAEGKALVWEVGWTPEMDQYLRNNVDTTTYREMSRSLNKSHQEIQRRCENILGLRRSNGTEFNQDFFKTWSREMAYVLGFTCADGSINVDDTHKDICWRVSQKDKDVLEILSRVMNIKKPIRDYNTQYGGSTRPCSVITISSEETCKDLVNLGVVPRKSYEDYLVTVPDEYFFHFLRGFTDGDGSVSVAKNNKFIQWILCSGLSSSRMMTYLHEYIISHNLVASLLIRDVKSLQVSNKTAKQGQYRLQSTCKNAITLLSQIYKDSDGLRLSRKFTVYQNYVLSAQEKK